MDRDIAALVHCPVCGVPIGGRALGPATTIKWNDKLRQFDVHLLLGCPVCGTGSLDDKIIGAIPVTIAAESKCACGSKLSASDHSFVQVGDVLEFRGTFVCLNCRHPKKTVLRLVLDAITTVWKQTKSIKVGADGVEYEKEPTPAK